MFWNNVLSFSIAILIRHSLSLKDSSVWNRFTFYKVSLVFVAFGEMKALGLSALEYMCEAAAARPSTALLDSITLRPFSPSSAEQRQRRLRETTE